MKKFISAIIALLLFISIPTMGVNAKSDDYKTEKNIIQSSSEYLGDGLYLYIELMETLPTGQNSILSTTSSKGATLTSTITDSSGNVLAKYVLSASFTYNGSTSTCTSANHNTNAYANGWSFSSATSSKSGNTAYGSYTAVNKYLLITIQTVSGNVSISCDKNGNITKSY